MSAKSKVVKPTKQEKELKQMKALLRQMERTIKKMQIELKKKQDKKFTFEISRERCYNYVKEFCTPIAEIAN